MLNMPNTPASTTGHRTAGCRQANRTPSRILTRAAAGAPVRCSNRSSIRSSEAIAAE